MSSFLNVIGHSQEIKKNPSKIEIEWYDIFGKFALQ